MYHIITSERKGLIHIILGSKHDLEEFFNNKQTLAKMGRGDIASQLKKEQRS